jgi:hypothetical protein
MTFWNQFPEDRLLVDASLWSTDYTRLRQRSKRVDDYIFAAVLWIVDGEANDTLIACFFEIEITAIPCCCLD